MRTLIRVIAIAALTISVTLVTASEHAQIAKAAECTPRTGPGIAPPANVPSGIPGLHAQWYGQSGYPTLCAGETSVATVAYYNSGSVGWSWYTTPYTGISLGTWNPVPGQDHASILGGDERHGSPHTAWSQFHRPAVQPVPWIGPGQVAWFQFTVKAPPTPGTYRLHLRPLIEGQQWLEDFGVYWEVTVVPTSTTSQRVKVDSVDPQGDVFTAAGVHYLYDRNDSFEWDDRTVTLENFEAALSAGDLVDVRYEPSAAERSHFNIVEDPPYWRPTIVPEIGNFDRGQTNNDIRLNGTSTTGQFFGGVVQRAAVPAGTTACYAISGDYIDRSRIDTTPLIDENVPSGTYCYRVHDGMWGYTAPVTMPNPPTAAGPGPAPRSIDARATASSGVAGTFDFGDRLKAVFDVPMRLCGNDTVIRLRDPDGTVAELNTSSRNIGCDRNGAPEDVGGTTYPAFTVLTLTIVAAPTVVEPGTTPGFQAPATVVAATGVRDEGGVAWDVGGSSDIVFGDPD